MNSTPRLYSWLIAGVVLLMLVGVPFLHKAQKHRTYRNFKIVDEGQLYRSGQMSAAGFERICHEYGIRTVIKLREPKDHDDDIATDAAQQAFCEQHQIQLYRREPLDWEVDDSGTVPAEQNLRWFEELLDDAVMAPRPILVHCFAGIHRTGAIVAVYRLREQGWSNREAVDEFIECGFSTTKFTGNQLPFLLQYRPSPHKAPR
jgi:protein-tyrosine phosphatase